MRFAIIDGCCLSPFWIRCCRLFDLAANNVSPFCCRRFGPVVVVTCRRFDRVRYVARFWLRVPTTFNSTCPSIVPYRWTLRFCHYSSWKYLPNCRRHVFCLHLREFKVHTKVTHGAAYRAMYAVGQGLVLYADTFIWIIHGRQRTIPTKLSRHGFTFSNL